MYAGQGKTLTCGLTLTNAGLKKGYNTPEFVVSGCVGEGKTLKNLIQIRKLPIFS